MLAGAGRRLTSRCACPEIVMIMPGIQTEGFLHDWHMYKPGTPPGNGRSVYHGWEHTHDRQGCMIITSGTTMLVQCNWVARPTRCRSHAIPRLHTFQESVGTATSHA